MVSVCFGHWIFFSQMDIQKQKMTGYLIFVFKIEKPKLKYKVFFFIMVKRGFTKLKKRDDLHFLLLKKKKKITRKQKQKNYRFFIFCYRKLSYKIRAQMSTVNPCIYGPFVFTTKTAKTHNEPRK